MSEQVATHFATQLIVPSYVWFDEKQQGAVLTRMAIAAQQSAHSDGHHVNLDDATVTPHMLRAVVGHVAIKGEDVAFVAYERTEDVEAADLVLVLLDVELVEP